VPLKAGEPTAPGAQLAGAVGETDRRARGGEDRLREKGLVKRIRARDFYHRTEARTRSAVAAHLADMMHTVHKKGN